MWSPRCSSLILLLLPSVLASAPSPIETTVSDGVTSKSYSVVYGDEDLTVINQAVADDEKWNTMTKAADVMGALPPLPPQDVKCLMSVNRYCSKDMVKVKNTLIEILKNDCPECSSREKEGAGRVVASMMAHDPVAWKMFLTRSTLQTLPPKKLPKQEKPRFKIIGEPETIPSSQHRYTAPGFTVRVKRYATERID